MPGTQEKELGVLTELGFKVNKKHKHCKDIEEVIHFWKKWKRFVGAFQSFRAAGDCGWNDVQGAGIARRVCLRL